MERTQYPVTIDTAEITMQIASVLRLLSGVSGNFDFDGSQYTNGNKAREWMMENYETVAGTIQTAAATLDVIYRALDENIS